MTTTIKHEGETMTRLSNDEYSSDGKLLNGYDYTNQCWVLSGLVVRCGHPTDMDCGCYSKTHAGELTTATRPRVA